MYHWGAMVLDLCNLPVEEYMKPMTVNIGEGGGGDSPTPSVKTYTLKYYINGTVNKTVTLAEGDEITQYTPSQEGYTFNGWYTDSRLTSPFTDTTMPARNVTVYGAMTANEYVLSFYNDNDLISSAKTAYQSAIVYPTMPDLIESGIPYTFVWDDPIVTIMPNSDLDIRGSYIASSSSDDFYYGIMINADFTGNTTGIESALTLGSISQNDPDTYKAINVPNIEDPRFESVYDEWYDNYEPGEDFYTNWNNNPNYTYSVVIAVPSDTTIVSVKQGDADAPEWVGSSFETSYGTTTINGVVYNVYGYRKPDESYAVTDSKKQKQKNPKLTFL